LEYLENKYIFTGLALVFVFLVLIFIGVAYHYIDMEIYSHIHTMPKKYLREIDTFPKEWLNGYMGTFFRFKYFGNLVFLTIPMVVLFFLIVRKPERWHWALVFVVVALAILVGLKGYKNHRYQLTMVPFLLAILMITGWRLTRVRGRIFKTVTVVLVVGLCLFNIYNYSERFTFFWNYKLNASEDRYPHQIMKILETHQKQNPGERVLVCKQPLYFYRLDSGAVNYRDPRVGQINRHSGDRRALWDLLRRQLNIKYIFYDYRVMALLKDRMFGELINVEGAVLQEKRYRLCRLRDRPFLQEANQHALRTLNLWDHKVDSATNASPHLTTLETTGTFSLHFHRYRDKNLLTVKNTAPTEDGRREIKLGYRMEGADLKKLLPEGDDLFLYLLVEARVSKSLVNRNNELFIRDKDEEWKKSHYYFTSPKWRSYLVHKRIRPGISRLEAGFSLKVRSGEEALDIRDAQAFITKGEI
jgi:hypothetical protein